MTSINNADDKLEQPNNNVFELIVKSSGIAHLVINDRSEKMNTLKASFIKDVSDIIKTIKVNKTIKGLVIISGKADSFIAGADIHMLDACETEQDAFALSQQGQHVFELLEQLPIPVIAAIHGPCLGGGLELALACHHRICSDDAKTVLGLPEVQLGLLPGGGGTQRLPRLIGLQKSLQKRQDFKTVLHFFGRVKWNPNGMTCEFSSLWPEKRASLRRADVLKWIRQLSGGVSGGWKRPLDRPCL